MSVLLIQIPQWEFEQRTLLDWWFVPEFEHSEKEFRGTKRNIVSWIPYNSWEDGLYGMKIESMAGDYNCTSV